MTSWRTRPRMVAGSYRSSAIGGGARARCDAAERTRSVTKQVRRVRVADRM